MNIIFFFVALSITTLMLKAMFHPYTYHPERLILSKYDLNPGLVGLGLILWIIVLTYLI